METTLSIPPIPTDATNDTSSSSITAASPFFRLLGSKELVFLELQGSIARIDPETRKLGRLVQQEDGRIYLVVGYQKMEGKLVTLKKPFAVLRRKRDGMHKKEGENMGVTDGDDVTMQNHDEAEETAGEVHMEVVEVCRRKIYFGHRPEPLNDMEV